MAKLTWRSEDFDQITADNSPYRYTIWAGKDQPAELRIIRRENLGGILSPMYDFSLFAKDIKSAMKLAQKIDRLFSKHSDHNKPVSL